MSGLGSAGGGFCLLYERNIVDVDDPETLG